jgi:hypothetical protein
VNAGTLLANNTTGSATGTGTVAVNTGATLGGTGTISGATTINSGATLTGATAGTRGTLSFGNNLTASAGSTWLVDLVGGLGNNQSDRINVGGSLGLAGNLLIADTGTWTLGESFQIAQYIGGISGTFSGLAEGSNVWGTSGGQYQISYGTGPSGFVTLTAVPEPSQVISIVLLLLAGLWFGRRRLRAAQAAAVEVES